MQDNKPKINPNEQYFAVKPGKDCASILLDKGASFFNLLRSNAYLEKLNKMWRAYYGSYGSDLGYGHQIDFTGDQGELVQLPVNHFRNLAYHIYTMVTANRPVMQARAINTDYKSLAQTYLANGILEYYMREKHLENALLKACEMAIILGSAFIKMEWNATAGEAYDYDEESGSYNYQGEIEFTNLSPFDVVFDGTKETWTQDWLMVRSFQNRYNLMAKYPELADKILKMSPKTDSEVYRLAVWSNDDTDDIPVYEFFHKQTEAVPDGRYLLFLDADLVLLDLKLPYRVIPVFRMSPCDIMGTPYGYSPMFDIFPLQEGINALMSSIMTNQNAFAVQNVFVPRGADIAIAGIEGGLNIIEANAKPEAIQLTATPPEVFQFVNILVETAETLSGVNSVARGNPEESLRSGNALALVQSMALQFMSGLQQSYVQLIENVGTALIQILKDYSNASKTITLVGKNNRPLLKEFTGEDISSINRVIVDMGNALSQSTAGRVQMAEQMMQMKVITNPEQYLQIINTGRLDSIYEGEMNELLNIKQENEQLLNGEAPLVAPTDKHSMHIQEHKSVISDPELRNDPDLVKVVMDHIEGHLNALRNTDPALLQIIGEQPLPPLQMPGQPPPGMPPQGPMMPPPGPMMPQGQQGPPPLKQPMPTKKVIQSSKVSEINSPVMGQVSPGQQISGPGITNVALPKLPKVNASLLPNPALQQQAAGNVRPK
jgi:hypothetical protein